MNNNYFLRLKFHRSIQKDYRRRLNIQNLQKDVDTDKRQAKFKTTFFLSSFFRSSFGTNLENRRVP